MDDLTYQNQWQYEETRVLTELAVALLRFLSFISCKNRDPIFSVDS